MNCSLENVLETKLTDINEYMRVFITSKTLHERFTRQRRCVFLINNGYTSYHKNNHVEGRVVFANREHIEISARFSSYGDKNRTKATEDETQNKLAEELDQIASQRRVVLMSNQLKDQDSTELSSDFNDKATSLPTQCENADTSTPKQSKLEQTNEKDSTIMDFSNLGRKGVKRSFSGQPISSTSTCSSHVNLNNFEESVPISVSSNRYARQSLYKWTRAPPTKEELDVEIDTYMAETKVKATSAATGDVDSFVREYIIETEKVLSQN